MFNSGYISLIWFNRHWQTDAHCPTLELHPIWNIWLGLELSWRKWILRFGQLKLFLLKGLSRGVLYWTGELTMALNAEYTWRLNIFSGSMLFTFEPKNKKTAAGHFYPPRNNNFRYWNFGLFESCSLCLQFTFAIDRRRVLIGI